MTIEPTQGKTPEQPIEAIAPVVQPEISVSQPASEPTEGDNLWNGQPFDAKVAKERLSQLREVERQAKKDAKELEQLRAEKQKRAEAEMTETQRLQKQADEAAAQVAKLQGELLRNKVIQEVNLPSIFTDRLQGSTYEEMLADAKKLADALPKGTTKAPPIGATNPANGNGAETDAQKRERLFGKQGNPFDLETIKAKGGGVIFRE